MNTCRSLLLLAALIICIVVPWKGSLAVPAVLSAAREQQVSAPFPSMITGEPVGAMARVSAGEPLLQLSSPDMDHQFRQIKTSTKVSRWQADQQTFDEKLLSQGNLLQRRLDVGTAELSGLQDVIAQLTLRAPFDGVIVARNDELIKGLWLRRKEPLFVIADTSTNRVDAYVGERELERISLGTSARFIPDTLEFGVFNCQVAEVDRVNIAVIEESFLASTYGGPIAARTDPQGLVVPDAPLFRVRMDGCSPKSVPLIKLKGVAHIKVERRSSLVKIIRDAYAVVIREIGF
jgi:putative peptide zinc metalloprotease protein